MAYKYQIEIQLPSFIKPAMAWRKSHRLQDEYCLSGLEFESSMGSVLSLARYNGIKVWYEKSMDRCSRRQGGRVVLVDRQQAGEQRIETQQGNPEEVAEAERWVEKSGADRRGSQTEAEEQPA